jgi:hypothetical protein
MDCFPATPVLTFQQFGPGYARDNLFPTSRPAFGRAQAEEIHEPASEQPGCALDEGGSNY